VNILPMFPLGTVLFPGGVLPLHVFEPRYRQLVVDCLADDERPPEFGVTMIERGSEVGGGDERTMVGTVARMVDVRALPGERYALVTIGVRRIRVREWLADDPYPRAEVEEWPDETSGEEALGTRIAETRRRLDDVWELARRVTGTTDERSEQPISGDPVLASYQLAGWAPIGPADRHRALCASGPGSRLALLDQSLDDVEAVLRFQLGDG
jgi:Lon protease-like protein